LGELPNGLWSRDGRYLVKWTTPSQEEYRESIEQHEVLPKISIWDSQTGGTRRYCIPTSGISNNGDSLLWSPDNRYLAFRMSLPAQGDVFPLLYTPTPQDPTPTPSPTATALPLETQYEYQNPRTMVLDTQTGYITILTDNAETAILWTEAAQ
jgi:hypothetical protein